MHQTAVRVLRVVSGNDQQGLAGHELPEPLVVALSDEHGAPIPGAQVTWSALDGGSVTPSPSITDSAGRASTRWTLGAGFDVHRATAQAIDATAVAFTATLAPPPPPVPRGTIRLLDIPTYDGSGQVVGPDVATVPLDFSAQPYWLVISPFPHNDLTLENPSVYSSSDGVSWRAPDGLENPVERPTLGYLSDPDIVYDPDANRLRLYYRAVEGANDIYLTTSPDGVHWDPARLVAWAPNHEIVSPTIVRRGPGDWWMFSVNAGLAGCSAPTTVLEVRRSDDGVRWSARTTAHLPVAGGVLWHMDVEWIAALHEFWMAYIPKPAATCLPKALYLATSADGLQWTAYPAPVLRAGTVAEFANVVYRSSVRYDAARDEVTFWYSGARLENGLYDWRAAVERWRRADLFDLISAPPRFARANQSAR